MRKLVVLAVLLSVGPMASADVIRCTDPAGRVSYTDGTCPAGAKKVARVSTVEPVSVVHGPNDPRPDSIIDAGPPPHDPREIAAMPPQVPSGPVIIDGRRDGNGGSALPSDSRWSDRGVDSIVIDDGSMVPAPGVSGSSRPRDMRPRIRSCGSRTCEDKLGQPLYPFRLNLTGYRTIDGRTCQPVGTTSWSAAKPAQHFFTSTGAPPVDFVVAASTYMQSLENRRSHRQATGLATSQE